MDDFIVPIVLGGYLLWFAGFLISRIKTDNQCADQAIKPDSEQSLWWHKLLIDARCRAEKRRLK